MKKHIEVNMRLRDYLWAHGLTNEDFGKKIRYSATFISNVMNGTQKPGPKFIEDVEKYTEGLVQEHEIVCQKGWMLKKKEEKQEKFDQMTFAEMEK
jgi:hypothetical protein